MEMREFVHMHLSSHHLERYTIRNHQDFAITLSSRPSSTLMHIHGFTILNFLIRDKQKPQISRILACTWGSGRPQKSEGVHCAGCRRTSLGAVSLSLSLTHSPSLSIISVSTVDTQQLTLCFSLLLSNYNLKILIVLTFYLLSMT